MAFSANQVTIAVATSIPPRLVRQDAGRSIDADYQRLCIQSWIASGFRILSINDREEIPDLAARYPEINFIATDRNASAWTGRKNPYIADLLLALKDGPEPVLGIINSDVLFEPSTEWQARLPSLVQSSIVIAHRYNTSSLLRGAFLRYNDGFDCFFFDRIIAERALEHAMPFAMGLPWWDHWLPCLAALNNRSIVVVDRPSIVHLFHKQAFTMEAWRQYAHVFVDFVIDGFENAPHDLPKIITAILPACREISLLQRDGPVKNEEYHRKISKLGVLLIPLIRKGAVCWDGDKSPTPATFSSQSDGSSEPSTTLGGALVVDHIFRHFDQRSAAGEALVQTKELLDENKLAEIGPALLDAIRATPDDFNALLILGEIAFRRGEFQDACAFLNMAAEQQPDSERRLHLLGGVLHAMNRHEEAIECFKKILLVNADHQAAYTALAKILWHTNRRREALECLVRAAQKWPDFSRASELYERYRQNFKAYSAPTARMRRGLKRMLPATVVRRLSGSAARHNR